MDKQKPCCGDQKAQSICSVCDSCLPLQYWCETCQQQVVEKRCPGCGLKARKIRLDSKK